MVGNSEPRSDAGGGRRQSTQADGDFGSRKDDEGEAEIGNEDGCTTDGPERQ